MTSLLKTNIFPMIFSLILIIYSGCLTSDDTDRVDTAGEVLTNINDVQTKEVINNIKIVDWSGDFSKDWKLFNKYIDEQKFEKASKIVLKIKNNSKNSNNSEELVKAIVKYTQLKIALHSYETAVKYLKEEKWPEDLLSQTVLNLYYADTIKYYMQNYSWEIRKREKINTKGEVDLKKWTMEKLYEESLNSYIKIWKFRHQLGDFSIDKLKVYINKNNYPRKIRETLRDFVTYSITNLLNINSYWNSVHINGVYKLNLKTILLENLDNVNNNVVNISELANINLHPLIKVGQILKDHEQWHKSNNKLESAFDARLTLFKILHDNLDSQRNKEFIIKELESILPEYENVKWWSVGMSLLVEFIYDKDSEDNLIKANELATKCNEKYPNSIGGKKCLYWINEIKSPEISIVAMANDTPGKKSVLITHKNIKKVYFKAFKFNLKHYLESKKRWGLYPDYKELESILKNNKADYKWYVDLEETKDFKLHQTYVVPPIEKKGNYTVIVSAKENFSKNDNIMYGVNYSVNNLTIITKKIKGGLEVTVFESKSGKPAAGVNIYMYNRYGSRHIRKPVKTAITNKNGSTLIKHNKSESYFIYAEKGNDKVVDPDPFYLYSTLPKNIIRTSVIYSDRSIYRPNQKIHWKAIVYKGNRKKVDYRVLPKTEITVTLMDPNHQTVQFVKVKTNKFGTASGEFIIPSGRLLGQWRIKSTYSGNAYIKVEEYKRPTFEAKIKDPESPLRMNNKAVLSGEVIYYFGLPVTKGDVYWKVKRVPVYPWWWGFYSWRRNIGNNSEQTVAAGYSSLNNKGEFKIEFLPEADENISEQDKKDITYRYMIKADITNEGGETSSISKSFRLGFVSIEATFDFNKGFLWKDKENSILVQRLNLNGIPQKGIGTWYLEKLKQPEKTILPADFVLNSKNELKSKYLLKGDLIRKRWDPNYSIDEYMDNFIADTKSAEGIVEHNNEGNAEIELGNLDPGIYRLHYQTKDPFEEIFKMKKEFVVIGENRNKNINKYFPLILLAEKTTVKVGENAIFYINSGLKNQNMIFEIYKDGNMVKRNYLKSNSFKGVIKIPVKNRNRGGFSVVLYALNDSQFMQFSEHIYVPWDNKKLNLEFSSFRDTIKPGSKEKWKIKVTDAIKGRTLKTTAELLAYMYDRSLDSFTAHKPPNLINIFPDKTGSPYYSSSLGMASYASIDSNGFRINFRYPTLKTDSLDFYNGHGIGGVGMGSGGRHSGNIKMYKKSKRKKRKKRVSLSATDQPLGIVESKSESLEMESDKIDSKIMQNKPVEDNTVKKEKVQVRSNFSETAFFIPNIYTKRDGSAEIEFIVPDSVTSWSIWIHALTKDLMSETLNKEVKSVKELMVRSYLPRFLREGDVADLKIVVNNASKAEINGILEIDLIDPESKKSILKEFGLKNKDLNNIPFKVKKGESFNYIIKVKTPLKFVPVAFQVIAKSKKFSDGELRSIPILPGRMHLMQSRFITLKGKDKNEMKFEDLLNNKDSSLINEQLVFTLDAQLFYSVLSSLPYLINYPYECMEQTLNRFLSTGIVGSLFNKYPAIKKMAKKMAKRKTMLETWADKDPNRKIALEETPWLLNAKGGNVDNHELHNMLDPQVVESNKKTALDKIIKAQNYDGSFPWFPGGPSSTYMTLYILYGFSKAAEFGVEVPVNVTSRAWRYLKTVYEQNYLYKMIEDKCCWETITFLNYILSNYKNPNTWTGGAFSDKDRIKMLEFSFKHWKNHSPYLKGYLALTLNRMGRNKDAKLVWESVMDSAKFTEEQGTFWTPEDRSWLWYNDTIETQAFAIRTLLELNSKDPKLEGLVQWIFLNKKLNHWKSTKATAEVLYSLTHYLKSTGQLMVKEEADVKIGDLSKKFVFDPNEYTGKKNQIVIPGDKIDPLKDSIITVEKKSKGIMFASSTWHFSTEKMPETAKGDFIRIDKKFYKRDTRGEEITLNPLSEGSEIEVGDQVEVHISIKSKHTMEYVHLRDPRAAGFEPENAVSKHRWDLGIYWYEEIRDSGTNFFFEHLPQGEYTFKYRIRAAHAGEFKSAPAVIQPMYAPEFAAYSSGKVIKIGQKK